MLFIFISILMNNRESVGSKHYNDPKAICENIDKNNPNEKFKILIAFDDMMADMLKNKNLIQQ